jgi:hypothetical protein
MTSFGAAEESEPVGEDLTTAPEPEADTELVFDGPVPLDAGSHNNTIDPSFSWSAPTLAAASMLGSANAHGSPQTRRRARILTWVLIVWVALPLLLVAVAVIARIF